MWRRVLMYRHCCIFCCDFCYTTKRWSVERGGRAPFFVCTFGPSMQWRGKRRRGPGLFGLARDLRNRQTTLLLLLFLLLFPLRRLINRARSSSSSSHHFPALSYSLMYAHLKMESSALCVLAPSKPQLRCWLILTWFCHATNRAFHLCMASDLAK